MSCFGKVGSEGGRVVKRERSGLNKEVLGFLKREGAKKKKPERKEKKGNS